MSRKEMFRRLDRLEARNPESTLFERLERVAGKTQKQANADVILAYRLRIEAVENRLTIDASNLHAEELEWHRRHLAEEEEKFAIRFKDDTSVVLIPEGLPPHLATSSRLGGQRAKL